MNKTFISSNDVEYTNAILDENRDELFVLDEYKKINQSMTELIEKIEEIPEEYKALFSQYDHLFHKGYEYEICLMYFLGLSKGLCFKEKK